MKCLIVDDEFPSREELKYFLKQYSELKIIGEYDDPLKALRFLQENTVDAVFLDINMPNLDGMCLGKIISKFENNPKIIFITAYDSYAVDAFKIRAFDYIMKPYSKERIEDTLTRLVSKRELTHRKKEVLQQNCTICIHRNPVINDELVADPVKEQTDVDRYADVREIEALPSEEKVKYFEKLLEPCIRCYACRNACPLCYCPTCFTDESRPQWVAKGQDPTDVSTFHFLRAYHCAGRCTDCGACERSCPVGINMRVFTKKLEKDCLELFEWEAGLDPDVRPPLDTYRPSDPDEFIK